MRVEQIGRLIPITKVGLLVNAVSNQFFEAIDFLFCRFGLGASDLFSHTFDHFSCVLNHSENLVVSQFETGGSLTDIGQLDSLDIHRGALPHGHYESFG